MSAPPDAVTFLGRFHPVLVHLPIGLIVLLFFFELLGFSRRFRHIRTNAGLVLVLAVPAAIVSAVCGWLLSWSGGYEQGLLNLHKWTGTATAAIVLLAALLYRLELKKAYGLCISASLGVLLVASHFGGSLTHGSDYLTQYAPKPFRSFLGGKKPPPSQLVSQRQPGSSPQAWADVVQPILQDKCVICHGPEKSKGSLRLESVQALLKGGDTGPAATPGKAAESELVKRLLLPIDEDDHMPPDGKPQPSEDEIALLRWWIDAGAPPTQTVAELKPPQAIAALIANRLKVPNLSPEPEPIGAPPKTSQEIMPLVERLSAELRVSLAAISAPEPWLQCNASVVGTNFGDGHLAKLAVVGSNLKWLDLGGTAVSDAGLEVLRSMPNLTRLHLERTRVTDTGLCTLTNLTAIEYLNLYGTKVTDAGFMHLQKMPRLTHLYVWQTGVTPEGAKTFAQSRTDKAQVQKWRDEIEQLKARIREQEITVHLGTVAEPKQDTASAPINTSCPVSGNPVQQGKTFVYQQKLVGFCCDDCRAKFENDPLPFIEKLGRARQAKDGR